MNERLTPKACVVGTHRASTLEATGERIWPLLPVFGITRVANITGLDQIGIPVVAVFRPNARSLSVAQGKGCSLAAAEVSGVMEAIEGFHAENISEPLLLGSYNQLRFTRALVEPETLPLSVLGRFHPDLKVHWIEATDLGEGGQRWVPYELVHTDFTLPLSVDSGCFAMTSNGLASGNTPYEALSHGISELIERDANTLFSLLGPSDRERRAVALDSIDSEQARQLLARFEAAGVEVGVWDVTSDVGVATFKVIIMDRELNPLRVLRPNVGTGCHPSREVALCRALTEAAQSRLTIISGSRDDLPRERYTAGRSLERVLELRAAAMPRHAKRAYGEVPTFEGSTIEEDVLFQRGCLIQRGLRQLLVVDLSKEELGISVVRVIVPGLEGSPEHPGWVPGRRALAMKGEAA